MTILQELAKELGVSDVLLEEAFEEVISSNSHWIRWNGGEQPFQDGTHMDVMCKNGRIVRDVPCDTLNWKHYNRRTDIIKFRVALNNRTL